MLGGAPPSGNAVPGGTLAGNPATAWRDPGEHSNATGKRRYLERELGLELALIVMNVVFHAYSLGFINKDVTARLSKAEKAGPYSAGWAFLIGGAALSATILHGLEVLSWAVAYRLLGALPDGRLAMLYSLNAMTSYGHVNLYLAAHWQLMGALEALNGWILFGLTTAFLFTVIHKAWLEMETAKSPAL